MRYLKALADAQNKLYLDMMPDSIFENVVNFYDEFGTYNDRIKCHYLLGCIYRDNGQAPMALKCYKEAIDLIEYDNADIDYRVVMSIFGQMGEIFYKQYFLNEAIDSYKKYSLFALKSGDLYNYIRGVEFQIQPYLLLSDTNMVYLLTDSAYNLYLKNNMPDKAVRTFPTILYLYIEKQDFIKSKEIIDKFEKESGLFDKDGNIDSLYGRFFYAKGLYYLGIDKDDSAEYFFRKLLRYGFEYDSYSGLLDYFRKRNQVDSIIKYSKLRDDAFDDVFKKMKIDATCQAKSMYDFMKIQHQKDLLQKKNHKYKLTILIVLVIFINIVILILFCYWEHLKRRKRDVVIIRSKYKLTEKQLKKEIQYYNELLCAYNDLKRLSSFNNNRLLSLEIILQNKQTAIDELEKELLEYKQKYQRKDLYDSISSLMDSDIVQSIKAKFNPFPHGGSLKLKEINELINITKKILPDLHIHVLQKSKLTKIEKLTSILIILDFNTSEISYLINTSISRVSNIKLSVNRKLFNVNSAFLLKDNLFSVLMS